jgi:hypothetical protein
MAKDARDAAIAPDAPAVTDKTKNNVKIADLSGAPAILESGIVIYEKSPSEKNHRALPDQQARGHKSGESE